MKVYKLGSYGRRGFSWVVSDDEYEIVYRTNENGAGLWRVGTYSGPYASDYQDTQIRGTAEFALMTFGTTEPDDDDYARVQKVLNTYFGNNE